MHALEHICVIIHWVTDLETCKLGGKCIVIGTKDNATVTFPPYEEFPGSKSRADVFFSFVP